MSGSVHDGATSVHRLGRPTRCQVSYERTNERTHEESARVTTKASLTDTCARVQDFDELENEL